MIAEHGSTHALIFVMGFVAYIGLLHLWFWRGGRGEPSHVWVAGWCLVSLGFQAARLVQVTTAEPAVAVLAGRAQVASALPLAYTLAGFASTLRGRIWSLRRALGWAVVCAAGTAVAVATPLLIGAETDLRADWFGHRFLGAPARPAAGLVALLVVAVMVHVVRCARGASLGSGEKRALLLSASVYGGSALLSLASATRLLSLPLLAPYAPLSIAIGLNYLLVHRHRRLTTELERMVEDRASELRESERRYRRLVDEAPVGVVACDVAGRITAINRTLADTLGSPSVRDSMEVNVLESEALRNAGVAAAFEQCMTRGERIVDEFAYTTRWGRDVRLRANIAPLRDRTGRVSGAQAVVEDISERAALERRLRQSRKMEAVGQLAAGIAHEINNPMAYVQSNLRMLREELVGAESELRKQGRDDAVLARLADGEELLDDALEGVARTVRLVREVKEFSHGSTGEREPVSVTELLDDALRYATPQKPAGVTVERIYGPVAPVSGSPGQLRQVFLNLIVNAFHAVGEHGTVQLVATDQSEGAIVRVEDDGHGIPVELRDRIFEPFFTTKSAGEGTGLGLYFSYEIVRMHGGELHLRSEPGVGTAFEVVLPRNPADVA